MFKLIYQGRIWLLAATLAMSACTKNFEQINTDPTAAPAVTPGILLTRGLLYASGGEFEAWRSNLIYCGPMVQHLSSLSLTYAGDKYLYNDGYSGAAFNSFYPNGIKILVTLINQTANDPAQANFNAMATITKVIMLQRLTDLHGDVPYLAAGRGFLDLNFSPAYDRQETIYNGLAAELIAAAAKLDAAKATPGSADISGYGGSPEQWKKLAYSLLLRIGLRLSKKSDPAKAKEYVQKAVAGGVFTRNEDIFYMQHVAGDYDNPNSHVIGVYPGSRAETGKSNLSIKLSKFFVDLLKTKNDPRLPFISELPKPDSTPGGSNVPALQKGLPNGYDNTSDPVYGIGSTGDADLAHYSQPRQIIAQPNSPNIFLTYSEVQLMLAEATARGWIAGDPVSRFITGVKSGIWQWSLYGPAIVYDDAAAQAYALAESAAVGAGSLNTKLEAINTQYYITTFLNEYEAYANWRRSGYPVLKPVNYKNNETNGQIPRRLRYPRNDYDVNRENVEAANAAQGADLFTTPVWWDKP
ncbi:SusD/RagB family nutrient-binding outer membrane lipoprotein [Chitinophaga nivalis]|uniref:SusD/RagB family nutrient-binding outer membrane lipoprotein n=1 Tax=Chitinophaga nivalis TaxID=2991709 RepID=A0ABT3IFS3_9BACT|nr:SusD/RagB family nutrient-binding outer membrane lipoprotein [Chitinophaga nivalis]MCW3467506.1 SusD/RagB family nutrient-binding outer membrane lipoprotein [Chitinophaga nivalis]MCW3482802.1 SusD/RagB family nutrient-binding outer membrane lipoprotein [Chitinophaga nivalis]